MKPLRIAAGSAVCGLAYAYAEARTYRVMRHRVTLPPGAPSLRVLHFSDTHLRAENRRLRRFLDRLPETLGEVPDLVLATGDLIEDDGGIEPLLEALGRLDARLGRFYVLGSHDYYRSTVAGMLGSWRMLVGREREKQTAIHNDTRRLEDGLTSKGWVSLVNRTETVATPRGNVRLTGIDDPYLGRHTTDHIRRAPDDALAIGLLHAPECVSEFLLAGFDLVLAGHTHAGQVRLPGLGSLVTNCSLPNALSSGLTHIGAGRLHVSPGLGTSRFAPVRVLARPEVTLLHLTPEVA